MACSNLCFLAGLQRIAENYDLIVTLWPDTGRIQVGKSLCVFTLEIFTLVRCNKGIMWGELASRAGRCPIYLGDEACY